MDFKSISSPLTRSVNATKRERDNHQRTSSGVNVGDVGYTFRKFFPGHGIFDGVVVDIHEGAGELKATNFFKDHLGTCIFIFLLTLYYSVFINY